MPFRKQRDPASKLREPDIDLVDHYCDAFLARHAFSARELPPGRRAWLEEFLARCLMQALVKNGERSRRARETFERLWDSFMAQLSRDGVVLTICDIVRLAHDPDGKEEARGWAMQARTVSEQFFDERDVREILENALETTDAAKCAAYPGWFGNRSNIDSVRANAARLLPHYRLDADWLAPLLDDEVAEVRHIAALRLTFDWPALADEKVLSQVIEAAADAEWIWSWKEHFAYLRAGNEHAILALGRFGGKASGAVGLIQSEIARTKRNLLELETALCDEPTDPGAAENNMVHWVVERDRCWIVELETVLRSIQV